jgi:uncharacterized repeat protein (TIGR04076 family)
MTEMRPYDIRVSVERIEGRLVCGLEVGDYFEVTESNRVRIFEGRHFCLYAVGAAADPRQAAPSGRRGLARAGQSRRVPRRRRARDHADRANRGAYAMSSRRERASSTRRSARASH